MVLQKILGKNQVVDMKKGKTPWGTYTSVFWKFYSSDSRTLKSKYSTNDSARMAQISILRTMSRKHIFDVRITRRKNVLYMEKTGSF